MYEIKKTGSLLAHERQEDIEAMYSLDDISKSKNEKDRRIYDLCDVFASIRERIFMLYRLQQNAIKYRS